MRIAEQKHQWLSEIKVSLDEADVLVRLKSLLLAFFLFLFKLVTFILICIQCYIFIDYLDPENGSWGQKFAARGKGYATC